LAIRSCFGKRQALCLNSREQPREGHNAPHLLLGASLENGSMALACGHRLSSTLTETPDNRLARQPQIRPRPLF
jgi:hypothetical protein